MRQLMRILISFILLLSPFTTVSAIEPFEVRVIYFRPLDAPPAPIDRIIQLMQETQEFYASEMERNGFGNKTFRIETVNNKIVIHTVNGAHNAHHYFQNTYQQITEELPLEFRIAKVQDNVHVFIVGGLNLVYGGALGIGWDYSGWRAGGGAILPGDRLNMPIIAHEIGHAFGLFHNSVSYTMMGLHHGIILDYETRWLSTSHYFNDKHIRTDIPQFIKNFPAQSVGDKIIKFKFSFHSKSGLHHSKVIRARGGYLVVGNDELAGENDVAEMDISRNKLIIGDLLSIRAIDVHGNYIYKDITISEFPTPIKDPGDNPNIHKNPDLDQDNNDNEVNEDKENENNLIEIENDCPGCIPDENDKSDNKDLGVSYQNKLTIQWARLKTHR